MYNPKTNNYYFIPLNYYIDDESSRYLCVTAKNDDNIVWAQPILVIQSRYPSTIINKWNGDVDLGKTDEGTIMAPRIVAGRKEKDNSFSGIMMGDWKGTDSEKSLQ